MAKKMKKDSHFIPSTLPAVTEYENEFIKIWNENTAKAVGEVLRGIAKETAVAIKDGLPNDILIKSFGYSDDDIEKARKLGDIHPNGKWYWGESASGKKDWKAIKGGKKDNSTPTPQPKNKTWKPDDMYKKNSEVEKFTTQKECQDFLTKAGILPTYPPNSRHYSSLQGTDIASAKRITNTLYNLHQRFNFEPINFNVRDLKKPGAMAHAINGMTVEVNEKYFKQFDSDKAYYKSNTRYISNIQKTLKWAEEKLKDPNANRNSSDTARLIRYKLESEIKLAKFPCFTTGGEKTATEDTIIHEMGHILNAQCSGGCGHMFKVGRGREYMQKCDSLNKELETLYSKYKKEDKLISEYSVSNVHEFFAENFVAYVSQDKNIKPYLKDYFDKYFKTTTPKI